MSVAESSLSPSDNKQGKKVDLDIFQLDQIPDAMRNMGWTTAPKLMEHWFSISPAYKFTPNEKINTLKADARTISAGKIEDTIVKMTWANNYINKKINELINVWSSPAGVDLLRDNLIKAGYTENKSIYIGNTTNTRVLDATAQVNFIKVGEPFDTINDWYGAIGNANLKIAVRGYTSQYKSKPAFIVESFGLYIKDTYDFLDDRLVGSEPLGIWSRNGVLSKTETVIYMESYMAGLFGLLARKWSGFVPVFNSDFREWQNKHNQGGDFILLSDILWQQPKANQKIVYL